MLGIFADFEQVKNFFQKNFVTYKASHLLAKFLFDFLDVCFWFFWCWSQIN